MATRTMLFVGGVADATLLEVRVPLPSTQRIALKPRFSLDELRARLDETRGPVFDTDEYILVPIQNTEVKLPEWAYVHVDIHMDEMIWNVFLAFVKLYAKESLKTK